MEGRVTATPLTLASGIEEPRPVDRLYDAAELRPWMEAALVIYVTTLVFDGFLRWVLVSAGAPGLIYFRDVMMIGVIGLGLVHQMRHEYVSGLYVLFLGLFAIHIPIGLYSTGNPSEVLFGVKILMNAWAGACMAGVIFRPSRRLVVLFAALWAAAVIGIMLDGLFLDWPWKGLSYDVGDVEVEAAREWSGDGIERVSGFARFSISAGLQIMLLSLFLVVRGGRLTIALAIFGLSLPALLFTTAKGTLISYLVVVIVYFLGARRSTGLLKFTSIASILLTMALPVWMSGAQINAGSGLMSLESLAARFDDVWPAGWRLIFDNGAGLLGRGIGGIGTPQRLFAPSYYNPTDNLFLFLFGYFGIFSVLYLGLVATVITRLPRVPTRPVLLVLLYLLYFMLYGTVVSVIEDAMGAIFLGAAIYVLFVTPKPAFVGDRYQEPLAPGQYGGN